MQRPCISLSRIPMTQSNGGTLRSVEKSDYLHRCAQFKGEMTNENTVFRKQKTVEPHGHH